jgi:tetratricopeptide (TPR) repeat protein
MLAGLWLLSAAGCGGLVAQSRNAQGVRLFDQARYQEALQEFEQAIISDPSGADGYYNLAAVYHRLGSLNNDRSHLDQAEHYYNQCLDRDAEHQQCYRGLAALLVEEERSEEAFRLLERWADRSPTSAEARVELARLTEEFGDRQAAKEHLIEALSVDPRDPRALAALGRLREQSGQYALAVNNYRQSLWQNQAQPEVAARIAALEPSLNPANRAMGAPFPETQMAGRNTTPFR